MLDFEMNYRMVRY